ncbi:MAG TPA: hypothetical protein VIB38_11630 [Aestuariivirgaceae bacterium]|jgi:hypothetical protein
MRLNRSDYNALQQAADIADAQRRLMDEGGGGAAASLAIGVTAGALLLFLTGALMQQLMQTDSADLMASEQVVWQEGQERIIR